MALLVLKPYKHWVSKLFGFTINNLGDTYDF